MKNLILNEKEQENFSNIYNGVNELDRISTNNIEKYLDRDFYFLLNPNHIKFKEIVYTGYEYHPLMITNE